MPEIRDFFSQFICFLFFFLHSGGRDRSLVAWESQTGNFLFAKRYCHGAEITAVDIVSANHQGQVVITGSSDGTVKFWAAADNNRENINPNENMNHSNNNNRRWNNNRNPNNNNNNTNRNNRNDYGYPWLAQTSLINDRIWSLAANPISDQVVVGSAGLGGIPALHMIDMATNELIPMGQGLKKGAGTLDLSWHTEQTFLSCGHDTSARLWDTRTGTCVRNWEEPFDDAIYCIHTDNRMTLLCGTARHGLVRLWDMRLKQPVSYFHAKHPHHKSSPVYSIAADHSNLYVAQDQSLNLISFAGTRAANHNKHNRNQMK